MRIILSILPATFFMFCAPLLRAQESSPLGFYIGPIAGVNFVAHNTSEFPAIDSMPSYFIVQNGQGSAPFLGISCDFPLSANHRSSLVADVLFDSKSAKMTSIGGYRGIQNFRQVSSAWGPELVLNYLMVSAGVKYGLLSGDVPQGPAIQLSASVGFVTSSRFNKIANYDWIDSSTGIEHFETDRFLEPIPGLRSLRASWRWSIVYDIPLNNEIFITPQAVPTFL